MRNRSGAIGAGVIAAHLGLLLLALYTVGVRTRPETEPLVVSMLEPVARPQVTPTIPRPAIPRVQPVWVPTPELTLPSDNASAPAATAAAVDHSAAQATQAAPAVEGQELPTMSQVAYLHPPVPRYPSNSRRAREEGLVLLAVTIDENGRVVSVSVKKSSGHARLDAAATDAVTKALFKPYSYGGVASAATAVIPIEFSLRGTAS